MFAANPQVGDLVDALRRVDDAAVGDAEGMHGFGDSLLTADADPRVLNNDQVALEVWFWNTRQESGKSKPAD
jgi:hypothetical protein